MKRLLYLLLIIPCFVSCGNEGGSSVYNYYMDEARDHDAKAAKIKAELTYGNDNDEIEPVISSYVGRPMTKKEYRQLSLEDEQKLAEENRLKAEGAKTASKSKHLFGR